MNSLKRHINAQQTGLSPATNITNYSLELQCAIDESPLVQGTTLIVQVWIFYTYSNTPFSSVSPAIWP
jgi:hypothetical protein